ncbi:MAG TPA: ABC transporter ATP-binding protein [Candidatus Saccharimonadales bacterium]|jgi:ABC-2 type transport system ATP-binding protein|nr:ABC transporter ATP-binding protein [Candidatus Saccharimonadales bacterium]
MDAAITVSNLSVTLGGQVQALKNVSLELPTGKITGFIGPSGAGKTTLIRSIVGGLAIPRGSVSVLGMPAGSAKLREQVSYMSQELSIYLDLTVRENLKYFVIMSGQPRSKSGAIINDILKTVDLNDRADVLALNLSGGQKQRLSLAVALIGSPKLMVLDEPTVGLDPVLREKLWQLFNKLSEQGITLIIASHSMDEASRCDDLVLIREGKVIAHSSPADLIKHTKTESVEQSFLKLARGSE